MKISNLRRTYARIYDTLQSRRDCDVEELVFEEFERENSAIIEGRIRFWDESILYLSETFMVRGVTLARTRYVYQYQDGQERLLFRYDNSPHHPQIGTFPHHKHIVEMDKGTERIEASAPPDLGEVLREIEGYLYPKDE
jgi:hypothetical protein